MTVETGLPRPDNAAAHAGAARRLRAYASAPDLCERLRGCVPLLREAGDRIESVRVDRYPWKGALAAEGTLAIRSDGGLRDIRSFRIEPRPTPLAQTGNDGTGFDDAAGMAIRVSPDDPELPELHRVLHGILDLGGGPLQDMALLGHRFGRRATLCARDRTGTKVLVKIFARNRAESLVRTLLILASGQPSTAAFVPRVLGWSPRRRLVLLEYLPGPTLRSRWSSVPAGAVEELGRRVRALSTRPGAADRPWTAAEERDTIRRFAARASVFDPEVAEGIERRVTGCAVPPGAGEVVRIHRDLHDGQVILGANGPALIDWDLAGTGPAAVDVGNFLAHLRLRVLEGLLPDHRAEELGRAFLAGFTDAGGRADGVATWEWLSLLRLAGVCALRPGSGRAARELLRVADRVEVES